ncbi:hypothetical protein HF1_01750 [Mycoplasma haemofelis str. Langford 1]|uniref:Lipoprotein n=1 Tax=Mycoplasma haemofelis (strain Langford 1) TaxID=941640 RepID=E8ZKL7_MYCHL|nr:hypothetical protein [Mycoplasma haemofelis]CBY92183.1 hypothetical protein HF1_01750 [Mycoplasma haemofelis str. Langford 1]
MSLKLLIPAIGGVGALGTAFAAGAFSGGEKKGDTSITTSAPTNEIQAPEVKKKALKEFSELKPASGGNDQCSIFYVSEIHEENGSYKYDGYKQTFNSKDAALNELKKDGLKDEDLGTVLCESGYGQKKYALAKEDEGWELVQVQ